MGEGFFCVASSLLLNVPGNSGKNRKHFNNSTKNSNLFSAKMPLDIVVWGGGKLKEQTVPFGVGACKITNEKRKRTMRKKSTRLLSAALAACMMLSVLPVGAFAAEPGAEEQENGASAQAAPVDSEFVEINGTNFPDPVFQQYVKDNIDTADTTSGQKDGRLSKAERDAVTGISIDNQNCTDLTGIAYFTNLTTLSCKQNRLNELDLKDNVNLTELDCSYNQLTTLDVSKNAKLRILECYNNSIAELNLGDITNLRWLLCAENNLTELDVSKNRYLERLHCRYNNLRRLVIGNTYSLTMLYLLGNHLTSLDLYHKGEIDNYDYATQSYTIDVNEDGTFDLSSLPKGFDASKTTDWDGGTRVGNTLNVNSHEVQYTYDTGSWHYRQKLMYVKLNVNGHKYQWKFDDTKHWRTCELSWCPGLTDEQKAVAPHVYDNAKDNDCNTCGYVRPLYTVTTGENVTAKLGDEVLNDPVAAGTEVTLTAGNAPEGKTFAGWKLYQVVNDTESEITDETELARLLKNGTATTATLTMPAYDVKAEPYYSDIPYNITAVDCTVDKTGAAMGDTVTATRRELEANEHFIGWTVKVDGVEQNPDTFLKPVEDDPTKVTFTMPDKDVEIKANFEHDPIPGEPIGPGDTDYGGDIVAGVVIGGIAVVGAYEVGTGLYRVINMPGIPMPSDRIELAELLWEHAGKPEPVSTALYSDIDEGDTDAQKAAHWAVEQDLMKDNSEKNTFNPHFPVSKLRTCLTWNAAKEKGLFDTDKTAE